jgi:hypothetical protein
MLQPPQELAAVMSTSSSPFSRSLFAEAANTKDRSISFKFRDSMRSLVSTLNRSEGHFVRCIKPNNMRRPFDLDAVETLEQLKCCGGTATDLPRASQARARAGEQATPHAACRALHRRQRSSPHTSLTAAPFGRDVARHRVRSARGGAREPSRLPDTHGVP